MEEQQMEVDSGIEENEEQIVEMKREEDLPLPYSPFTSSYVVPNFSSRKSSEEISLWSQRKKELEYSLQNIQQIATQLVWLNSPTISLLQQELVSLANFYQFLLETRVAISYTDWGYFCVLPTELIIHIFSYLDYVSLCRCAQVCKEFYTLAYDERLWKCIADSLHLPIEDKPDCRTWKWLCQSRLKKFKEGEERIYPGTYYFPSSGVGKKGLHCYSGDWVNGKRHGYGSFYWEKDAGKHTGEWKDDKREGFGIRIWPNGNKYIGEYKNHKRHGKGTFIFSNGSKFCGEFEENKFLYGTYTWPNGRIYTGEWNNTNRHGKGTYCWPDGRVYEGEWRNDKRHGKAIYRWPDGDHFEGEFVEGARWGKGVLVCSTGEIYDQDWKELKFDEMNKGLIASDPNSWCNFVSIKRKQNFDDEGSDQRRKSPKTS